LQFPFLPRYGIVCKEFSARSSEVAPIVRLSYCIVGNACFVRAREMVTIEIISVRIMGSDCFTVGPITE
jgi:hypothetical protein